LFPFLSTLAVIFRDIFFNNYCTTVL